MRAPTSDDERPAPAKLTPRRQEAVLWLVGLTLAVVVMGPALGAGSLLTLDLVTTPEIHVPRGVWGLGPELPRRVPLFVVAAWISKLLGGDLTYKLLLGAPMAVAFVGAARRCRPLAMPYQVGGGLLYAASPFVLTRVEVGHTMVLLPMALLPWALPCLARPGRDLPRLVLWSIGFGVASHYGGLLFGVVVLAGLATDRWRRWGAVMAAVIVGQLPWLAPGIVVWAQGGSIADSGSFPTDVRGVPGAFAVLSGHGFWQRALQVGWESVWLQAAVGLVVGLLAIFGTSRLPDEWRRTAVALGAVGYLTAVGSAVPLLDDVTRWMTATPAGALLREGQRLLPAMLVWLAPAAAHGAHRGAQWLGARRRFALGGVVALAPAALAVLLAAPGAWGFGGVFTPVAWPSDYEEAKAAIDEAPGTVVGLPWHLYFDLSWAANRRVLHPLPHYLGGDVVTSSDPGLDDEVQERADPRERRVDALITRVRDGEHVADELAALGVRWVVVLHETERYRTYDDKVDWLDYRGLLDDPDLVRVVEGAHLTLYRVSGWRGPLVDDDGDAHALHNVVTPFARPATREAVVWQRPAASGWRRGLQGATATPEGLLALPAGRGPVWYAPAVVVLAADAVTLGVGLVALRRLRRSATGMRGVGRADGPKGPETGRFV